MNLARLYEILNETTIQLRKGEVIHRGGNVTTIDCMPHIDQVDGDLVKIDMEFLVIGVDKPKADACKSELVSILRQYPHPERLAGGPSYIEVGTEIGDQGAAFQLFALGKVLGIWDVITPASFHMSGEEARQMAGQGFIMITGFRPDSSSAGHKAPPALSEDGGA